MSTLPEQTWPPEGLLPPLPESCYPPGAVALPEPQPRTLLELRPLFSPTHGDDVAIGFDSAMELARQRAGVRGHRQVVTRCYSDEQLETWPSLRDVWMLQDWR